MTDFNDIGVRLAEQRAGGNFTPLNIIVTLAPMKVRVDAVSGDGQQMAVTYADRTTGVLRAPAVVSIDVQHG